MRLRNICALWFANDTRKCPLSFPMTTKHCSRFSCSENLRTASYSDNFKPEIRQDRALKSRTNTKEIRHRTRMRAAGERPAVTDSSSALFHRPRAEGTRWAAPGVITVLALESILVCYSHHLSSSVKDLWLLGSSERWKACISGRTNMSNPLGIMGLQRPLWFGDELAS